MPPRVLGQDTSKAAPCALQPSQDGPICGYIIIAFFGVSMLAALAAFMCPHPEHMLPPSLLEEEKKKGRRSRPARPPAQSGAHHVEAP